MQEIADIFTEVQSSTSIPKNMVRILNESYKKNQKQFTYTLEQCFLKILNKLSSIKTPPKKMYENFEKLLEKFLISLYKPEQTKENLSEKDDFKSKKNKKH